MPKYKIEMALNVSFEIKAPDMDEEDAEDVEEEIGSRADEFVAEHLPPEFSLDGVKLETWEKV